MPTPQTDLTETIRRKIATEAIYQRLMGTIENAHVILDMLNRCHDCEWDVDEAIKETNAQLRSAQMAVRKWFPDRNTLDA